MDEDPSLAGEEQVRTFVSICMYKLFVRHFILTRLFAWHLTDVVRYKSPVPLSRKLGWASWVNLQMNTDFKDAVEYLLCFHCGRHDACLCIGAFAFHVLQRIGNVLRAPAFDYMCSAFAVLSAMSCLNCARSLFLCVACSGLRAPAHSGIVGCFVRKSSF